MYVWPIPRDASLRDAPRDEVAILEAICPSWCEPRFCAASRTMRPSYRPSSMIMVAACSAIIAVGVLVLPEVMVGITDASAMRRPEMP